MEFCITCGTRMVLKRRGINPVIKCQKCGYEKVASGSQVTLLTNMEHNPQKEIAFIGRDEQKLRTMPTIRVECLRCGNKLAYVWQVQTKGTDESSTQFFRCTRCNYTNRENS